MKKEHLRTELGPLSEDQREVLIVAVREAVQHRAGCTCCPAMVDELVPAVARLMAVAWDEAILHIENFIGVQTKRSAIRDNPYREGRTDV